MGLNGSLRPLRITIMQLGSRRAKTARSHTFPSHAVVNPDPFRTACPIPQTAETPQNPTRNRLALSKPRHFKSPATKPSRAMQSARRARKTISRMAGSARHSQWR